MTQTSWPFDSQTSTETDWSRILRQISALPGGGVNGVPGDATLQPYADSTGMQVKVRSGQAMVRGHMYMSDATVTLAIGASTSNPRIDAIVLTLDPTANSIVLAIVAGTAAASPVAPTLTQTDTAVYQLLLGTVYVAASSSTVSAGNITDVRSFLGANVGVWTSATRPVGVVGLTGYNTTIPGLESYNGTTWVSTIPTALDASVIASGTLSVARGGTGQSALAAGFIKSDGLVVSGGNGVVGADISATEQANIAAGSIRNGGLSANTAIKVFVQSSAPTGTIATGSLWFW
jgi:hypothetical protein